MRISIFSNVFLLIFLFCVSLRAEFAQNFPEIPSDDLMNLIVAYDRATNGNLINFLTELNDARVDAKKEVQEGIEMFSDKEDPKQEQLTELKELIEYEEG